jgi:hypothetical protein
MVKKLNQNPDCCPWCGFNVKPEGKKGKFVCERPSNSHAFWVKEPVVPEVIIRRDDGFFLTDGGEFTSGTGETTSEEYMFTSQKTDAKRIPLDEVEKVIKKVTRDFDLDLSMVLAK